MTKKLKQVVMAATVACACMLFLAAGIHAADTAGDEESGPGVMKMKNEDAFKQHRMGIVTFDHNTHAEEYDLSCGECHHDDEGNPLQEADLDEGSVKSCFACHDKEGRPQRDSSMSPEEWEEEKIGYYYEAIHQNCMGCHKEKGGPAACPECHPRPER
ncbi:MAG: cytochrome c3 family protein [Desulfosalsimonadaceae bacterium]